MNVTEPPRRFPVRSMGGLAIAAAATLLLARTLAGRRGIARTVVTYPPLDVPKRVAEGIWIVDSGPISAFGLELPVRMTVVRLTDGDLLLHSPTRFTPELAEALAPFGRIRHLVAPSLAHWMFVADWQHAFPDARTWATPSLRKRAAVRRSGLRIDADLGDAAPPDWSGEITLGEVRGGADFSETWFFHHPSRTLILTDLIENLDPARLPRFTALVMRAALATRATCALHVRALLALNRAEVRAAVDTMIEFAPERIIFAHGRWFERDGTARLRDAFGWLPGGRAVSNRPA